MTGSELQAIRRFLHGTDTAAFGRSLGIAGDDETLSAGVRRLEGRDIVPEWYAKLARAYESGYRDQERICDRWPSLHGVRARTAPKMQSEDLP